MSTQAQRIDALFHERPRSLFLRYSGVCFLLFLIAPWISGDFSPFELLVDRRQANLRRFLSEIVPYPLQGKPFELDILVSWSLNLLQEKGLTALVTTLAISVVAIVLAGVLGGFAGFLSTRTLLREDPFLTMNGKGLRGFFWRSIVFLSRSLCLFVRAVPEYIWAFVFLMLLGPSAWPAILALAIHNAGVIGKLNAETMENLNPGPLRSLRALGATRSQLALAALFPLSLGRHLLFFFYRWEMCVRESTVLGLLGIVSLGYWIQDARARNFYDEMFFFVALGGILVLVGDLISAWVRERIRNSA